jgi:hypothetical protein
MRRSVRRFLVAGMLMLTLAFGYAHSESIELWSVLFDQIGSGPGSGGNGGGGGG